jgi:hypothetical protein
MLLRSFCSFSGGVFASILLATAILFGATNTAQAATCSCTCRGAAAVGITVSSCTSCNATCEARCGAGGTSPTAISCTGDPAPAPEPTPSTPSQPGSGGTTNTRRPSAGTNSTNSTGEIPTGICLYNCTTPRATTCTTNEECVSACNTNCVTLVGNSTCATNPAPRCAPAGADGRRTCIFECQVAPPDACTVGDAGNSVCGSRSAQICRPPAGTTGGSAPVIAVSTAVQPRCVSPRGTPSGAGNETSGSTNTSGGSSESGGGTRNTYALTNPVTGANTIPAIIGKGVRALMGLVGAVALLMFVIGGVRWILSAGDPKDVQAAQDMLRNASIGLLIIFLS